MSHAACCLLLFLESTAVGAVDRAITVRDAVQLALNQNPSLAAAAAEVDVAQGNALATRGLDDPYVDASASVSRSVQQPLPNVPFQQPDQQNVTWSAGVTQPLPTGGKVGVTVSNDLAHSTFATTYPGTAPELTTQASASPSLALSASHPLLRGAGIGVARAPRRRADAQEEIARAHRDAAAAEVVRSAISAWWELALAERELSVRRAAVKAAEDQLTVVRATAAAGKEAPTAPAEVEVAFALRQDEAHQAEQAVLERQLELARICGLEVADASRLVPAGAEDAAFPSLPELNAALEAAQERAPQLVAVRAQGASAEIEVDVTRNGLLPQLDLALSGGLAASAPTVPEATQQLEALRSYFVQASLVFQEPIPLRTARGQRDAASAGVRKAKMTEKDLSAQIATSVVRLRGAAESAHRRYEVLTPATKSAAVDLEAERARYELGRGTNFDVLHRQDEVAETELRKARAVADYMKAVAALTALTGAIAPVEQQQKVSAK